MLLRSQKIQYLLDSAKRYFEPIICPFCNSNKSLKIDQKYIVTRLFECKECHLYYRHPIERISKNEKFYQDDYVESDRITTTLPSSEELSDFIKNGFNSGNKNAQRYKDVFLKLFPDLPNLRVVDYGSSWGYVSWQLANFGFDVESYEISKPRALYGNKYLGLNILMNESEIRPENDIFFSSHVIEHHPSLKDMISLAKLKLKKAGYFIAISPNGSLDYRKADPAGFHHGWGKVHPNYLNVDFYRTIFKDVPYYIGSSPFDLESIRPLKQSDQIIGDVSSEELIVIARIA